ncbi:MAG: 30S ribosomal protein S3 [Phycisphaerae bacterium]|nr:30S ribosomal protein S3 [Phycisphaerae bacterium]NIW94006.1 30S ribosomal protein S3 [Phycisphaerae bacterium]NIW99625.1 30S ribosomal protein S3 [Phycisphaerae bacterium]NIX29396.1 30S ribosomal protein S3 [Phycisphaerae bacterium]
MGRKVHPVGLRLGIIREHESRWYAEGKEYAELLDEDFEIRQLILKANSRASISKIEIERLPVARQISIKIHTAKPGILIGRKGQNVNVLRKQLEKFTDKKIHLDILEVSNPDIDAYLIGESIAGQLERRISHKRAMKQAIRRAMRAGAKGVMIAVGGRLGGADMARRETQREGRIPRHTLRADIDYAQVEALTTFSKIGVKVWVYKGDILPEPEEETSGAYSTA